MAVYNKVGLIDKDAIFKKVVDRSITKLDEIDFGDIIDIGWGAFSYCTNLTKITIPNDIKYISQYAFYNCTGLTSIILSENIEEVGFYAFANCTSLASVTVLAINPPDAGTILYNTPIANGIGYIYVPVNSVDAYKNALGWRNYASQIRAIQE